MGRGTGSNQASAALAPANWRRLGQNQRELVAEMLAYVYTWVDGEKLRTARRLEARGLARLEDAGYGSWNAYITDAERERAEAESIYARQWVPPDYDNRGPA